MSFFNAEEVKPSMGGFEVLPKGHYKAMIRESEEKATKAGTGKYLALTWVITEGDYKDRRVFQNLNLDNPSEKAVQIAKGQLSTICHAVNVLRPETPNDLHDKPAILTLGIEKDTGFGEKNKITNVRSVEAAAKADTTQKADW